MHELTPTLQEVRETMLSILRHVCQVEFYLNKLNLGHNDPQRPHDIVGEGNKYDWNVLKGLAIQYRQSDREYFNNYVLPSIELHRKGQYHHQMWNTDNPKATPDDMKVGAVDALCSLLDNRKYQGGAHSFEDIVKIIKRNEPYKVKWFWMVFSQMKRIEKPNLELITDPRSFPNVDLPSKIYNQIQEITLEAIIKLNEYNYEL